MDDIAPQHVTPERAAQRPLGTTAKSSSPPSENRKRRQRFEALMQARQWLGSAPETKRSDVKYPGDVYRTHDCKWATLGQAVYVFRDAAHNAAHYGSLVTCGSVWSCPVCASKIQQRRRTELEQLTGWVDATKRSMIMVTFTFPHTRIQSLKELLLAQREAFKKLRSGKAWMKFKRSFGLHGLVRSLEITNGSNGWHPHTHELWVLYAPVPVHMHGSLVSSLVDRWEMCCIAAGLLDPADQVKVKAFRAHSVDVRWQVDCSDYLAKQDASRAWGVESELALSTSKKGRAAGVHPHEFLVRQADGDRQKYIEFVDTTKALRARQLYWSAGLKALCGLADKTDEELAEESTEFADLFDTLTVDQWKHVRGNGIRAHLLERAAVGDTDGFLQLLYTIGAPLSLHQLHQITLGQSLGSGLLNQRHHFLVHAPLLRDRLTPSSCG